MLSSYNLLITPETRQKHDMALLAARTDESDIARMSNSPSHLATDQSSPPPSASPPLRSMRTNSEVPVQSVPPEDLGAPPPSARPFAYVDKEPDSTTPAARAGLRRGDAILRIGDASQLGEVQGALKRSVDAPLPALVIDLHGRFMKKWIVPRTWDPLTPASLLGCQMSDQVSR